MYAHQITARYNNYSSPRIFRTSYGHVIYRVPKIVEFYKNLQAYFDLKSIWGHKNQFLIFVWTFSQKIFVPLPKAAKNYFIVYLVSM